MGLYDDFHFCIFVRCLSPIYVLAKLLTTNLLTKLLNVFKKFADSTYYVVLPYRQNFALNPILAKKIGTISKTFGDT